ncbi:MAG: competence/damage-inducible protein A [Bacteroidota bacterium]|nr:competence/damage-inducible protein A [Bacteroidota bacterium]
MKAEIITIGDELLIGQTVDTNSAWIGSQLSLAGFDIQKKISVHDKRQDILNILADVEGRAEVIIITGGLGPTSDDITKYAVCEFFNTQLIMNEMVYSMIQDMMQRRKFPMNENNRKQAEVPESCRVLTNAVGTAPGMWFEKNGSIYVFLPGVPYEMKYIMTEHVLPELKKRFSAQFIVHKNIMTYGVSEARLAEMLTEFETGLPEEIKLAYLPSMGINKLRLTGTGNNHEKVTSIVNEQVKKLYSIIPDLIYGEDEDPLEAVVGKLLTDRKKTLSTAESCTGGNIAHLITTIPGSSKYFMGSIIAYDNSIKRNILGISEDILEREGAVSETVVRRMAENCRKLLNTSFAVATSGVAGPDGGTETKPVGTFWVAVSSDSGTVAEHQTFGNDRMLNITRFSFTALNILRKQIIRG